MVHRMFHELNHATLADLFPNTSLRNETDSSAFHDVDLANWPTKVSARPRHECSVTLAVMAYEPMDPRGFRLIMVTSLVARKACASSRRPAQ